MTYGIDGKWLEFKWWCPLCWLECWLAWWVRQCQRFVKWLDGDDVGGGYE